MGKPRAIVNWEGVDGVGLHISYAGQERSRNANSLMRVETKTRSGAFRATGSMKGNDGLCERS
jgi:hypothetical protein